MYCYGNGGMSDSTLIFWWSHDQSGDMAVTKYSLLPCKPDLVTMVTDHLTRMCQFIICPH